MLKEQRQLIQKAAVFIDCLMVGSAFFLAYVLRDNLHYLYPQTSDFLRPPLPAEVDRYEQWQKRRLSLRQGIACIHEVLARDDRIFESWMNLDLQYIDNWSLSLDFRIFMRSVLAILKTTGC